MKTSVDGKNWKYTLRSSTARKKPLWFVQLANGARPGAKNFLKNACILNWIFVS